MSSVTVVDYDCGNLLSVAQAFEHCGASVNIARDAEDIARAERLVLPGVGAFATAMNRLGDRDLVAPLRAYAATGRPFLGICLGMQLLFESSLEFGHHDGLALIPGQVVPIPHEKEDGSRRKIPHIGWAALQKPSPDRWQGSVLAGLTEGTALYFVHSFVGYPKIDEHRLADVEYEGARLSAAVRRDNVVGTQFHPEKSGPEGLSLLRRFLVDD
ncbi:imidazole glycerol phosphate synthase subunit HisH [Magnetospira sp. QH-2]|uniref:imidazole glycerol phosphate synthase subunit HisH n=1 Tax=Magnetospira sp. (strain QH-2) TaxID=1288970 RepID=UPI0003E80AED|nr:imidazole glycerol phosphate synthase subunit HisH [Magnetospira sp. QH-2]CCQ75506.1 Imidazole glycerol phosphate synthase subunit HisH [Magnetospira sp. QH-2]